MSNQYESERDELLEVKLFSLYNFYFQNIKALKNIVKQLDGEKKDLIKKYEINVKELTVKINRLERNNVHNYHSDVKMDKFSPSQKIKAKLAKSKEKEKNYSSNLSISKTNDKDKKYTKGKEIKISNKLNEKKNNIKKKAKSPSNRKILSTSLNANEMSHSNYNNNDSTPRVDKSSTKTSRSNSKSSSRLKKHAPHSEKDNSNLKISQISLLSGFGTNSVGFLSPVQTNASFENISSLNKNLLNQYPNIHNDNHNLTKGEEINNKIFSNKMEQFNKEEIERNNYLSIINNTIFELERNIADMTRNYKNQMIKLNVYFKFFINLSLL